MVVWKVCVPHLNTERRGKKTSSLVKSATNPISSIASPTRPILMHVLHDLFFRNLSKKNNFVHFSEWSFDNYFEFGNGFLYFTNDLQIIRIRYYFSKKEEKNIFDLAKRTHRYDACAGRQGEKAFYVQNTHVIFTFELKMTKSPQFIETLRTKSRHSPATHSYHLF